MDQHILLCIDASRRKFENQKLEHSLHQHKTPCIDPQAIFGSYESMQECYASTHRRNFQAMHRHKMRMCRHILSQILKMQIFCMYASMHTKHVSTHAVYVLMHRLMHRCILCWNRRELSENGFGHIFATVTPIQSPFEPLERWNYDLAYNSTCKYSR